MNTTWQVKGLGAAAALVLWMPAAVRAQPASAPQEAEQEAKGEIKRLDAWPKADKKAAKFELERLRKARTPEMGQQAEAALLEMGAAAAPYLLEKYGKEKNEDAIDRMTVVLDGVTGAEHTRLLAEHFTDKDSITRIWCLRRVAMFPDAGVREAAEKAFATADGRKRKRDKHEVYAAAACSVSSGSFAGFDYLLKDAEKNWKDHGASTHTALTALRGAQATARILPMLEKDDRTSKVAGLRLLAACGDKETATSLVAPLLDSTDNSIRVGAINALRGIVDGDPPLPRMPVFEAIERADKWKSRI